MPYGSATKARAGNRFLVSVGWAKKVSAQRNRTGQAERIRHHPGRKPHADLEAQQKVAAWIGAKPDLTLSEIQIRLSAEAGVRLSLPQIWHLLRKLGLRLKKKSLHASERDTETNRKRREEFVAHIRTISPERLIFLDESGVTTSMTRLRARCQGGRRMASDLSRQRPILLLPH